MAILIGFRRKSRSKKDEEDYNRIRLPEEIPAVSKYLSGKKNEKAVELLKILWFRCMNRKTGDCKLKNEEIAKLLGVTDRSVCRYFAKLKKHGYISILTERRSKKDDETQIVTFSATRFIRVWAAVYHSHYNIVPSDRKCWSNDFRPNAYFSLKKIPLKYKIKKAMVVPTKKGNVVIQPRSVYYREDSNISLPSILFQSECAQPGRDIIPVEAWDEFFLLQDAAEDIAGYPGQKRAEKILGHSFQDYRTRWVIKSRYLEQAAIAKKADGLRYVVDPISADKAFPNFKEYKKEYRRTA